MTRQAGGRQPRSSRASRDPYGIGPIGGFVGPFAAVIGLVVVAILTLNLFQGQIPLLSNSHSNGGGNGGGPDDGGDATPAPSGVIVTPAESVFEGSILYAKAGNIWIQSGTSARQLTNSGQDSMPTWSADGSTIYFVRVTTSTSRFPTEGTKALSFYDLFTPQLMRVNPDGTGDRAMLTGKFVLSGRTWFYWLRQPVPSPDGKTIALVSDGPNPLRSDIVLQTYTPATKTLKNLGLSESLSLGHQDPAWSPNGRYLYYVRNGRDGTKGAPQIYRYDTTSKATKAFTGPGYLGPAPSPDGRWMAATRTDAFDTNVVILDSTGAEVLRVTSDGRSFAPTWSPAGDAIAFLHLTGTSVDLRLAKLDSSSGQWAVTQTIDLTRVSALDGTSRPSWFIPPDQLPAGTSSPPAPPSASSGSSAAP